MKSRKKLLAAAALVALAGFTLAGCGDKATEPYQDAPRTPEINSSAAEVIEMPDGFNNMATKCDHGNRVYAIFHSDSSYGAVAVVAQDPSCK